MADETQVLDDDRLISVANVSSTAPKLTRFHGTSTVIGGATATLRSMMLRQNPSPLGGHVVHRSGVRAEEILPNGRVGTRGIIRDDDDDDEISIELREVGSSVLEGTTEPGGRSTARLSPIGNDGRVGQSIEASDTGDDAPHQTATSHISPTQDGSDHDRDASDHQDSTSDNRPTHHYYEEASCSRAMQHGGSDEGVVMVAPSAPSSNAGTHQTTKGSLHSCMDPNKASVAANGARVESASPKHRRAPVTQLTYGGTLLVQDLSPRDCDGPCTPTAGAPSGGSGAEGMFVFGGAPKAAGVVDNLPATLDDGIPKVHSDGFALAFSDSEIVDHNSVFVQPPSHPHDARDETGEMELIGSEHELSSPPGLESTPERSSRRSASASTEHESSSTSPQPVRNSSVAEERDAGGIAMPRTTVSKSMSRGGGVDVARPDASNHTQEDAPFLAAPLTTTVTRIERPGALATHAKPSAHSTSGASSAPTPQYQVGELVEAKWGAAWYEAVVVSILGRAVEVKWRKDNSTVHVALKHVRHPKGKSVAKDGGLGRPTVAVVTDATPRAGSARPSTSHASPLPAHRSERTSAPQSAVKPTSTQLVQLMEEEDELEQQLRSEQRKAAPDSTNLLQHVATPEHHSNGDASTRPTGTTTSGSRRRRRSPSADPHDMQRRRSSHILEDFDDSATPPSALLYFSPCALAELPSDTRIRCKREMPRVMIVESLRNVVSWAMNSTFQTNVPFVMLLSKTKLQTLVGGTSTSLKPDEQVMVDEEALQPCGDVLEEQQALLISTALGLTALDYKWISASLRSLSGGGEGVVPHEPYALSPLLALPPHHYQPQQQRAAGSDAQVMEHHQREQASFRAASMMTVRLFPIPKTLRAFYNDVVWSPTEDRNAELLIQAAGGCVVREATEALHHVDKTNNRSGTTSSSSPPSSTFLYVASGRRVGSALREPKLAALVQVDLPGLQRSVVKHFQSSVCTRPVSCATAAISSPAVPSTHDGHPYGKDRSSTVAPSKLKLPPLPPSNNPLSSTSRFLAMEDSQREIPPLLPPKGVSTSTPVVRPVGGGGARAVGASSTPRVGSAIPPHHQPLQWPLLHDGATSCSQPVSHMGRVQPTNGGAATNALRRRWPYDLRITVPRDDGFSQSVPHHPASTTRSLVAPLPMHDDAAAAHSTSTAGGQISIAVGDDFYFVMPTRNDSDEILDDGPDDSSMGIGRVSSISEGGDSVVMRLYDITSVSMHRRNPRRGVKRSRDDNDMATAASHSFRRLTTMVLTEAYATIPIRFLDVETPLFVVDEHLLDHLYILERPPPVAHPGASYQEGGNTGPEAIVPVPNIIAVRAQGSRQYVEVGTVVSFRPPPLGASTLSPTDGGNTIRGVVRSFERDSAVPEGLFLVMEVVDGSSASNDGMPAASRTVEEGRVPQRAVITPDMIVKVHEGPPLE